MAKKDLSMNTVETEVKGIARAVSTSLKRAGHGVPRSVLLHALAAALDKRDWHTLKASLATRDAAPATPAAPAQSACTGYAPRTLFWLKLAHLSGRPVAPVPVEDAAALAAAQQAVGNKLSGVLSWGGWNVPASLALSSSNIDAGHFQPDAHNTTGNLRLALGGANFVIEAAYAFGTGWYVTEGGVAQFVEQAARAVSDAMVLSGARRAPALVGPAVRANFWTDDRTYEVEFDARPYFVAAPVDALLAIAEVGFVGDAATDQVAEHMAEHRLNETLVEAFEYLGALQRARPREPVGFECAIEAKSFYRWMDSQHRRELAVWLCTRAGVRLVEAEEEEIRGMWDWLDEQGHTSAASQPTLEDAALDAYRTLNLLQQALDGAL